MVTDKDRFTTLSKNYSATRNTSKIMSQMREVRNLSKKNLKCAAFFQRVTEFGNLFVDNSNYVILVRASLHEKPTLSDELRDLTSKVEAARIIGLDGKIIAGLFRFYPELSET